MKARLRILLIVVLVVGFCGFLLLRRLAEIGRLKLPAGQLAPIISLGDSHGLVLAPDGSIWSWGGEDRGWPVLGLGKTNFTTALLRIGSETNWVSVSAGEDHNLALKSDGTIWAWGANHRGQLGDGNYRSKATNGTSTTRNSPVPSVPGNDWTQVVAGSVCSYALKKDGTLWAWGLNNFSQLGIGSWVDSPKAAPVGTATNWTKMRAGGVSAGGIQSDGSLWIWGGSSKLGNTAPQNLENLLVPTRVTADTNWVDLSVDYNLWLAIKSDGTLWAWGRWAHVFTGAAESECETPTQIGTNTDWQSVSPSRYYHLLRKRDGSTWVMNTPDYSRGSGRFRQLGLPKDVVASDTGGGAVAVVTRDGEVWVWGTVLGQQKTKERFVRFLAEQCWRFGWKVQWGSQRDLIIRDKPWQLRNVDTGDSTAK